MRKVFLEDLPRRGKTSQINWKASAGSKVRFIYDDIEGEIKIIRYNKDNRKLTVIFNDKEIDIKADKVAYCMFAHMLEKFTKNFRIEIGDCIIDDKRNFTITNREYREFKHKPDKKGRICVQNFKWYRYTCNKCGWTDGWIVESDLLRGNGCSCCGCISKVVVEGINDIATTSPWMIDLGVDIEEARKFTYGSGNKIKCTCPYCGDIIYKSCNDIHTSKSIGCICGDGFSYPEKFICSVLKQLSVKFETQLSKTTFKWCNKYYYDFYIPSLNMIVETHGLQHYEESFSRCGGKNLIQEQENDKFKKELALNNGIECYVELDCSKSELEYIKNSILNSELNGLFDLSNVDWLKCEEYALGNLVKEVCNYWNNKEESETTTSLVKVFKLNKSAIIKYLNQGTRLGWCNYNPKEESRKSGVMSSKKISKKVEIFNKDKESLGIFESTMQLERESEELFEVKLSHSKISLVCNGKRDNHKGFTFKYVDKKEGASNG